MMLYIQYSKAKLFS